MADPFEKVPEFLAAFRNVETNGFFTRLNQTFNRKDSKLQLTVSIIFEGLITGTKSNSVTPFDPELIIIKTRELCGSRKPKSVTVETISRPFPGKKPWMIVCGTISITV